MIVTVYLRVAEGKRGMRVAASSTPNYEPIYSGSGSWNQTPLPTAAFALELDVPDELFTRAEQVLAEIVIPEDKGEIAVEVKEPIPA
jgi:hypothetical protein